MLLLYLHGTGLPDLIQPILDEIASECRELVRLTVAQGGELAWLAYSQGAAPGPMYQPAMTERLAVHATTNGKAWLANDGKRGRDADHAAIRPRQIGAGWARFALTRVALSDWQVRTPSCRTTCSEAAIEFSESGR